MFNRSKQTIKLHDIIAECKKYNKLAQKLLYEEYSPIMSGVCYRYVTNTDTLKDIIQEGFIKAFSKINQYNGEGSFEGWLKRIFINTAISHIRKQKNIEKAINIDHVEDFELIDLQDIDNNIDELNYSDDKLEIIRNADFSVDELLLVLEKIPEKYRIVFNLFCIENYDHAYISDILEINITTSRTRLLRARSLIQDELLELSNKKKVVNA